VNPPARFLALIACLLPFMLRAEAVKDREGAVRGDRAVMEKDARWIYNDVQKGFGEARRTGKPLMVVIRCVPCLACMGLDARVLSDASLAKWLDQFVCVRLINANAIDLSVFQFDYDLSFSTLFFNGDGTLYGRYGSWTHQKNPADKTIAGYTAALEAALALHKGYPGTGGDSFARRQIQARPRLGGEGCAELCALPPDRRRVPRVVSRPGQAGTERSRLPNADAGNYWVDFGARVGCHRV